MNKIWLLLCVVLCSVQLIAQPKDNSPFSRVGLGDISSSNFGSSASMGGLSAVYHDFFEANISNPASLGFLQYTTFQVGMFAKGSNLKKDGLKESVWSGNLNHLSLSIPLINPINELLERRETKFSWATSFSILPYSTIGYDIESEETIDSIGTVLRKYTGEGGTYKVTWGNGWKYKNFSVGLNLAYLYGRESFESNTDFQDLISDYNNVFNRNITYKGFDWDLGFIYDQPLDLEAARKKEESPSKLLSMGFSFSSDKSFNTTSEFFNIALNEGFGDADTASFGTNIKSEGVLPSEWSIGVMYRVASKYKVGFNYTSEAWSHYENGARNETLNDSWQIGAGFGWIPDATSITSYFKRVEYRIGVHYLKDPRVFGNEQLTDFNVQFGFGMPFFFQRQVSWLNIGLDIGGRGTSSGIKDNYVRGKIGITLNDNQWFIKRKYN